MYLNFQIKNKNVSMRDSKHIFLALNWLGWEIEKMKLFKPLRRRHRRRNWYVFYIKNIKISMFIFNVLTKSSYLINTGSVYEDGYNGTSSDDGLPPRKQREKTGDAVTDLGHSICDSVSDSMSRMTSTLFGMVERDGAADASFHPVMSSHASRPSDTSQNVSDMNRIMDLMERLDKEKIRLEGLAVSDGSNERRLKLNRLSMNRASEMLDRLVSNEDEDADENRMDLYQLDTSGQQQLGNLEQLD